MTAEDMRDMLRAVIECEHDDDENGTCRRCGWSTRPPQPCEPIDCPPPEEYQL